MMKTVAMSLLESFVKVKPPLDAVPKDRLIDAIDPMWPFFTSLSAKSWIRSGFLLPYFAEKLGLAVFGAFVDGNVGVLRGFDVLAFRKLEIKRADEVDLTSGDLATYSSFSSFCTSQFRKHYGPFIDSQLPPGLNALLSSTQTSSSLNQKYPLAPELIIFHTELMPDDALVTFWTEVFRVIRRQLPALGEEIKAHWILQDIDAQIKGVDVKRICEGDTMLRSWLAGSVHATKHTFGVPPGTSLSGSVSSSGSPSSISTSTTNVATAKTPTVSHTPSPSSPLSSEEMKKLRRLMRKHYNKGIKKAKGQTLTGPPVPKNPDEAIPVDIHRNNSEHVIENSTIEAIKQLPLKNRNSLLVNSATWRDGCALHKHRFPTYGALVIILLPSSWHMERFMFGGAFSHSRSV